MSAIRRIVARHPLSANYPYNAIRFAEFRHGKPLYTVCKEPTKLSARKALARAMELCGGHCFHCGAWMKKQKLSHKVTRDHLHPTSKGGSSYLHNIVFACGDCNSGKAAMELIDYRPDAGKKYLSALTKHLDRCIEHLAKEEEQAVTE